MTNIEVKNVKIQIYAQQHGYGFKDVTVYIGCRPNAKFGKGELSPCKFTLSNHRIPTSLVTEEFITEQFREIWRGKQTLEGLMSLRIEGSERPSEWD